MEVLLEFAVSVGQKLLFLSPGLACVGSVLIIVTGVVAALTPVLKDDGSFEQIRKWAHKPGFAVRYRALIRSGLSAADRFYGVARGLSWQGFIACCAVALIYPFLLWQLAWAMNGPMTIGGVRGFDDSMSSAERWIGLIFYWTLMCLLGVATWKLESMAVTGGMKRWRQSGLSSLLLEVLLELRGGLAAAAGFLVGGVLLAGIAGVRVGVVAGVAGLAVAVAAGVGVTGFAKLGGVTVAVAAAWTIGAGLCIAVVAAELGGPVVPGFDIAHAGVVLATMLVLVPATNAVMDHFSVQVSRWLLTDLVERRGAAWQWLVVLGHVIADIIAAGVFLVVLAVLLPALLQLANCGFGAIGWPLVDWPLYLHAARTEPF